MPWVPPEYILLHLNDQKLKPGPGVLYVTFNGDDNQASINNPDIFTPSRQRLHVVKTNDTYSFGYKEGDITNYLAKTAQDEVVFTKDQFLWTVTPTSDAETTNQAYISSGNKYISFNKFGLKIVEKKPEFAWQFIAARPPSMDPE